MTDKEKKRVRRWRKKEKEKLWVNMRRKELHESKRGWREREREKGGQEKIG